MKFNRLSILNLAIVSLLALVFFIATSSFNLLTQRPDYVKWTSPDETANYFFSKRLAQAGQLAVFDPAAVVGDNMVMPRSVRSDFGWLKPVSFLGIILSYGSIASVLGIGIIPYLTPLFASFGIIIFYLMVSRIFDRRTGLVAAFLLACFPVYGYYTVRSMFHNVLFIVYLLVGAYLYLLSLRPKRRPDQPVVHKTFWQKDTASLLRLAAAFFSGLFTGLALITRTSELLWLAPAGFIIWVFSARRLGISRLLVFLAGLGIAFLPIIYWNTQLYGGILRGGYNEMNRSLDEIQSVGTETMKQGIAGSFTRLRDLYLTVKHNIFYFGFNPGQSIMMLKHYVLEMFPLWVYAGAAGLLLLVVYNVKKFNKKYLAYALSWGVLSLILVLYYGSWRFNDNPDPARFTIGNSYTRYWLPIYLMLIPLVSLAIVRITRALVAAWPQMKHRLKPIMASGLQALCVLVFLVSGVLFVLYGSEEGLAYLYHINLAERDNAQKVFALTDPEGIIITQYYDKFFFPERRIIMGKLPDDQVLRATAKLVRHYPVYYYNFFLGEKDVAYLNARKFAPYGVRMELVKQVNDRFGLYRIYGTK